MRRVKTSIQAILGGSERNVEQVGTYIAWLVSNNHLSTYIENSAATAVTRVRMQDLSGAEFLTTVLSGELRPEHLSPEAQRFTEHYYLSGDFQRDYDSQETDPEDDWYTYKLVSPRITTAYMAFANPGKSLAGKVTGGAKILSFPFGKKG